MFAAIGSSLAFAADATPPTKPIVIDDGIYTTDSSSLHATWTSADPESGIGEYQYLIRQDSSSGLLIVDWTSVGAVPEVTHTGLNLIAGKKYHFGVKAKNGEGLWSKVGYSDGIKVDTSPPSAPGQPREGSSSTDYDYDADGSYTIYWSVAADPESRIAAYELQEKAGTTGTWATLTVTLARKFSVTGRLHNTQYFYQVRAKNGAGLWGPWSPTSDGISVQTDTVPSLDRPLPRQGFGADTPSGEGQPIYRVTNLNDSGPGSLRDAVSHGYRYVVFDVGGVIETSRSVYVEGPFITIDGFTAPPPGITIKHYGLKIHGSRGAHDIVVQGIRVHVLNDVPGEEDAITVAARAHNILIHHVSARNASDENIGINNAYDVTVSWSILAEPRAFHPANMLITNGARRISVHHNLFIKAGKRNPWVAHFCPSCSSFDAMGEAPEIQADVRNNLMWDVSGDGTRHGTVVFSGGKANIINNYYKAVDSLDEAGQKRVIVVCKESGIAPEDKSFCGTRLELPPGSAYVAGNVSADGWTEYINTKGTETDPFPAAPVDTSDACTAAQQALAYAGPPLLDPVDQQYRAQISLPPCPGS